VGSLFRQKVAPVLVVCLVFEQGVHGLLPVAL
jgi:hypothetical protein